MITLVTSCSETNGPQQFSGGNRTLAPTQSGVWRGFWIHQGVRGEMNLDLSINNFKISGGGNDLVGPFTLNGDYNDRGIVNIHKQYLNAHAVHYKGEYENNLIKGRWYIYETNQSDIYEIGWYVPTP